MSGAHIFLSYNRDNRDFVITVRKLLRARGFTVFLDTDSLVAGIPWPQALENSLGGVQAVVVFVGKHLGGWQKREIWFALDRQVDAERQGKSFPVIPVLLPGADPATGFLFSNTWVDIRTGDDCPEVTNAIDAIGKAINVTASSGPPTDHTQLLCPYRGLEAFREEDSAFFAGRKAFSERLLGFVLAENLVAVVGPSGSGKSSVIQAGLVPRLRRQRPPSKTWDAFSFTPGTEPLTRLALTLMPLLEPNLGETDRLTEAQKLGERLADGAVRMEAIIDRVIEKSSGTNRLLVAVDQFEEIFTITPEPKRRRFADALLQAIDRSAFTLLLAVRADFYGQIINLDRHLSDRIACAQVNIGALKPDELRDCIGVPARLVGLELEAGLAERLVTDVGTEPGSLPLLEFALSEIWQQRQDRTLTNSAYDRIGGLAGALAGRAEAVFARFSPDEKEAARRLFSRLVHVARPDEGAEDTRQRIQLDERDSREATVAQAFALAEVRLLVTGRDEQTGNQVVEVAHEALIQNWDRLRAWLNEDREFLLWRQRIDGLEQEWRRSGNDTSYLLHGTPLLEAEGWLSKRPGDLNDRTSGVYINSSIASRDTEFRKSSRIKRLLITAAAMAGVAIIFAFLRYRAAAQDAGSNYRIAIKAVTSTSKIVKKSLLPDSPRQDNSKLATELLEDPLQELQKVRQEYENAETTRLRLELYESSWNNLYALGEWSKASAVATQEYEIAHGREHLEASSPYWPYYMIRARQNLADDARHTGDLTTAVTYFSEALKIAQRLCAIHPEPVWKYELAHAEERLGDAYRGQHKLPEALAKYEIALSTLGTPNINRALDQARGQRNFAVLHGKIGDMLVEENKLEEAEQEFQTDLEASEKLNSSSSSGDSTRGVAIALERLGFVRRKRGELPEAKRDYQRDLQLLGIMVRSDKADFQWLRDEAIGHEGMGDVLRDSHDWIAALGEYEKYLSIMVRLLKEHPSSAVSRHDVATGHQRVAEVRRSLGQKEKARSEFQECMALIDASAPFDPRNPEPRDLGERCRAGISPSNLAGGG